jgi:SAM-dependent methyltransferase
MEMPAEDLSSFASNTFQVIISKHVVEHLQAPEKAIAEMNRVLVSGGMFLLVTPNLDSKMRAVKKEKWIGYQDPTHISLKTPEQWLELLKQNHLIPARIYSDGFWDAPYVSNIPTRIQKLFFGLPGGIQAISGICFLPLRLGESLITWGYKE